jgi:hypothetical protein
MNQKIIFAAITIGFAAVISLGALEGLLHVYFYTRNGYRLFQGRDNFFSLISDWFLIVANTRCGKIAKMSKMNRSIQRDSGVLFSVRLIIGPYYVFWETPFHTE